MTLRLQGFAPIVQVPKHDLSISNVSAVLDFGQNSRALRGFFSICYKFCCQILLNYSELNYDKSKKYI